MIHRILSIVPVLALVLNLQTLPAPAQAVTSVTAQEVTEEVTPVPVEQPNELPPSEVGLHLASLFYGIIVGILGGGGFASIILRIFQDKQNKDAAEKLFLSFPPETKSVILDLSQRLDSIVNVAVELSKVIKEVTDGRPNDTPSTLPPGQSV